MQESYTGSLRGQFIMAMPGLADPNFYHTVTCICEHNQQGAMGLVVNRVQAELSGKDVFEELGIEYKADVESIPVYIGGPVHMGEVFILHGPPFDWEACMKITPSLGMSNTRDILESIALGDGPGYFSITLGCAGWAPGQLEHEIKENAWLNLPIFEENIFEMPVEVRWEEAVKKLGIDPTLLTNTSGHA
jgi:putative transcriptional regulator